MRVEMLVGERKQVSGALLLTSTRSMFSGLDRSFGVEPVALRGLGERC